MVHRTIDQLQYVDRNLLVLFSKRNLLTYIPTSRTLPRIYEHSKCAESTQLVQIKITWMDVDFRIKQKFVTCVAEKYMVVARSQFVV
jgi:hypothetical protein